MPAAPTLDELLAPLLGEPGRAAVLLDVDGTLAPIVRDPEAATVPEGLRRAVNALTGRFGLVGCVSGRRAAMARRMVGIGSIPYAGNHGAEILLRGSAEPRLDPDAERWTSRVHEVAGAAAEPLREYGVRVEDKGPIVALHWRGVDDELAAEAAARNVAHAARDAGLHVHEGRKVLELRPPVPIGKDAAVRRLLASGPGDLDTALYAGDDRTDADAFAGLRALVAEGRLRHAVCIGVRSDETPPEILDAADALVDGTDGVRALLEALAR
ncbi:MAG: trehalose-phosphatase [Solirubrobacteraceae bacterium]|jgi:trehalose 6-phosphate phosphatase|nr:trehalose-phosphatase [Solirubrobacteraceae bacterium]